jgi:hypothetical protein
MGLKQSLISKNNNSRRIVEKNDVFATKTATYQNKKSANTM